MAIFDTDLDYSKLIQFTNGTLQLGSFTQIRNALTRRMQEIYGNDIDVSPASADGQYINSLALIFNNIFQTLKQGYDSLDPAVATGQYLDTLCSFNNIERINATSSTCQLYLYNSTNQDIIVNKLTFIDTNNTLWLWDNGGFDITIPAKNSKNPYLITDVECEEKGSILAPGANAFYRYDLEKDQWIKITDDDPTKQSWDNVSLYANSGLNGSVYQCVEQNGIWVWQYKDADVGEDDETDEELRNRRYMMLGNSSVTILEGLKGNLLNITGVKDVFIFNNRSINSATLDSDYSPFGDNNIIPGHSIYVVIRYKEGVEINANDVGRLIYNKLTPGIGTAPLDDADVQNGIQGSFEMVRTDLISDYIYWKICKSISPSCQLHYYTNVKLYDYAVENGVVDFGYHTAKNETEKEIVKNLQAMISETPINDFLTISNMLTNLQQSDPQKQGMNTYFVQSGTFGTTDLQAPANLSYFKYNDSAFFFKYDDNGLGAVTSTAHIYITENPITLDNSELTLNVGGNDALAITGFDSILPPGLVVEWESTDDSIASVSDNGDNTCSVTGVAIGECYIICKYGDLQAKCKITVE